MYMYYKHWPYPVSDMEDSFLWLKEKQQFVAINIPLTLCGPLPGRLSAWHSFHCRCCMIPDVDLVNPLLSKQSATGADQVVPVSLLQTGRLRNAACLPTGCCDLVFFSPPAPEGNMNQRNCWFSCIVISPYSILLNLKSFSTWFLIMCPGCNSVTLSTNSFLFWTLCISST